MLRPIDFGMLNGRILLAPSVQDTPWRIHPVIIKMVRGQFLWFSLLTSFLFRSAYLLHRHSFTFNIRQGLPVAPQYGSRVQTLLIYVRHPEFSIICIGSESCISSIVGLPGSCACYPTFRSIG